MMGRLFAVVGPSGAGKDRLLGGLVAACPEIHRARRTITRPAAQSEDFESLSVEDFARVQGLGEFALHWQAHGLHYGIRPAELSPLAQGRDVVFNGSRAALPGCVAAFPTLPLVPAVRQEHTTSGFPERRFLVQGFAAGVADMHGRLGPGGGVIPRHQAMLLFGIQHQHLGLGRNVVPVSCLQTEVTQVGSLTDRQGVATTHGTSRS